MIYKVANIVERSEIAGPNRRLVLIASKIKKEIKTVVLLPKTKTSFDFVQLLKKECISYKEMRLHRLNSNFWTLIKYLANFPMEIFQLTNYFRKEKFNLIHVSGGTWQYKGVIAGFLSKTKVIWHVNDSKNNIIVLGLFSIFSKLTKYYIFASEKSYLYYKDLLRKDIFYEIIQAPVNLQNFQYKRTSIRPKSAVLCTYSTSNLWALHTPN